MKLKDILLCVFGFLSLCAIIYFSFIDPVIAGVHKLGAVNFVLAIVVGIVALTAFMKLKDDDRIQEPYKTIGMLVVIGLAIYAANKLK